MKPLLTLLLMLAISGVSFAGHDQNSKSDNLWNKSTNTVKNAADVTLDAAGNVIHGAATITGNVITGTVNATHNMLGKPNKPVKK